MEAQTQTADLKPNIKYVTDNFKYRQLRIFRRCDEIPSGFRHIARRLCRPKPFQGLRTSEGFAKCKTLRKASGRWQSA